MTNNQHAEPSRINGANNKVGTIFVFIVDDDISGETKGQGDGTQHRTKI